MLKHMKYEFRKSLFSKIVILIVTGIAEIAFLIGVFAKSNEALAWGVSGLMMCALIGIFYIGIESITIFHKDLNTKQSYMLFMTPYSSYEILGAKIVQNAISIFAAGVFFVLIAVLDAVISVTYLDGLQALIDMIQMTMKELSFQFQFISAEEAIMIVAVTLVSWLFMVAAGYLAIVLCATVLAGKKISGLASFLIYLVINFGVMRVINLVADLPVESKTLRAWLVIGAMFIATAVMYAITGWIMERKLSV